MHCNGKRTILAYIESPLQLLCALEATKGRINLIVRRNNVKKNNEQIVNLCNIFSERINIVYTNKNLFFARIRLALSLVINSYRHDKIVIGDITSIVFKVINRLKIINEKKMIFVDDGVLSLWHQEYAISNNKKKMFTFFEIDSARQHKFENLKNWLLQNKKIKNKPINVIIGTDYKDFSKIINKNYDCILDAILKNRNGNNERFIYVPHRKENEKKLERIKKKYQIEIVKLNLPIELIEYELECLVLEYNTMISSSVFTLNLIYECSVVQTWKSNAIFGEASNFKKIYNALPNKIPVNLVPD